MAAGMGVATAPSRQQEQVIQDPKLKDALSLVLDERGARYGRFQDQAVFGDGIVQIMESSPNWKGMAPDQREALRTIAAKISRICNGDPNYDDSWVDIAGYARLISDRLQGK